MSEHTKEPKSCAHCNGAGFVATHSPTTGHIGRLYCNHDGTYSTETAAYVPQAERDELIAALRQSQIALATAFIWALTERGGYDHVDKKYHDWAQNVLAAVPGNPRNQEVLDSAIESVDALLARHLRKPATDEPAPPAR